VSFFNAGKRLPFFGAPFSRFKGKQDVPRYALDKWKKIQMNTLVALCAYSTLLSLAPLAIGVVGLGGLVCGVTAVGKLCEQCDSGDSGGRIGAGTKGEEAGLYGHSSTGGGARNVQC
jgi:hypothetical protein